jgi:hypothetical protein
MHHNLASILTAATLVQASLPQVPAQQALKSSEPVPSEQRASAVTPELVEQAVGNYRSKIREIYLANGKTETMISDQIDRLSDATRDLCKQLDPNIDTPHFDKTSLIEKIDTASKLLYKHGFIVGSLDMTAHGREGNAAVISLNLDKVIATSSVECSQRDFSSIGCPTNPLPKSLPFFQTQAVIPQAPGANPLAPLSALTIDRRTGSYGLLLSHDSLTRCLPGYSFTEGSTLDPKTRTFLLDWALGRLAFHMAGENGSSALPQSIRVSETALPLRNLMGLSYALLQNADLPCEVAIIVYNYFGMSGGAADSALLGQSSTIIRKKLSARYPGIETLDSCEGTRRFFEKYPEAAKAYISELRTLTTNQVKTIEQEMKDQTRRKNRHMAI